MSGFLPHSRRGVKEGPGEPGSGLVLGSLHAASQRHSKPGHFPRRGRCRRSGAFPSPPSDSGMTKDEGFSPPLSPSCVERRTDHEDDTRTDRHGGYFSLLSGSHPRSRPRSGLRCRCCPVRSNRRGEQFAGAPLRAHARGRRHTFLVPTTSTEVGCASDSALCLGGGRFQIQAMWKTADGTSGSGHPVAP